MKNSNEADINTQIWMLLWDIWLKSQDKFSRYAFKALYLKTLMIHMAAKIDLYPM